MNEEMKMALNPELQERYDKGFRDGIEFYKSEMSGKLKRINRQIKKEMAKVDARDGLQALTFSHPHKCDCEYCEIDEKKDK